MGDFGWLVNRKDRDHGEDVLVDIYDEGQSSGLSLLVQLKSTADLGRCVTKKDATKVHYRLDVSDLDHWERSAQLIVVVIWDIVAKNGVWLTVPEILKQLGAGGGWRKQKTVVVSFLRSNNMGDRSLRRLRHLVADRNYPILKRGKRFQIKTEISFPATTEGRTAAEGLRAAINYGDPVRIEGKFIEKWDMSGWWERLYGKAIPQHVTIRSSVGTTDIPVRLEVDSPSGTYRTSLELRRLKAGKKGFTLSNQHQRLPLRLTLVAREADDHVHLALNLQVKNPVPDVFHTKEATELLLAMRRGTQMRVVQRETGKIICESPVPVAFAGQSAESLEEWRSFLEKLCYVQSRIYKYGRVVIRGGRVSRQAAMLVETFFTICKKGFIERPVRLRFTLDLTKSPWEKLLALVRKGEKLEMKMALKSAGDISILGVKVPLGPMNVRQDLRVFAEQIQAALSEGKRSVAVAAQDIVAREEFPDWAPVQQSEFSIGIGAPAVLSSAINGLAVPGDRT